MFNLRDPVGVMEEAQACRDAYPNHYVSLTLAIW